MGIPSSLETSNGQCGVELPVHPASMPDGAFAPAAVSMSAELVGGLA